MTDQVTNTPTTDTAKAEDVVNFYRLALLREPESEEAARSGVGDSIDAQTRRFFSSEEFVWNALEPLRQGRLPGGAQGAAASEVLHWAARRLPLTKASRGRLKAAPTWIAAYAVLFSDKHIRALLPEDHLALRPVVTTRLKAALLIRGHIEQFDRYKARGWACRNDGSTDPVRVEIWRNGGFLISAQADQFRREVQEQFGGDGVCGFEIQLPPIALLGGLFEVREARSGLAIGAAELRPAEDAQGELAALKRRIDDLSAQVSQLSAGLRHAVSTSATPLDRYEDYHEAWVRGREAGPEVFSATPVQIVIDIRNTASAHAIDALEAALKQTHAPLGFCVVAAHEGGCLAKDLCERQAQAFGVPIQLILAHRDEDWRHALTLAPHVEIIQLAPAVGLLRRDAVAQVATALDHFPAHDAVYFDEDVFVYETGGARRGAALLKPEVMDQDLLLQAAMPGPFIGFRRAAWDQALETPRPHAGAMLGSALLVGLDEARIKHLNALLATRWPDVDPMQDWVAAVTPIASGLPQVAAVERHSDILAAEVPGAARIKWAVSDAEATVIIPTRDSLDLLRPCIDSLLDRRDRNLTRMKIVVVDHESRDPETLAYLERLEKRGEIERMPFSGAFNWALMNNLASAKTESEVLVFLNNDTIAVSDDWLDELTGQALRAEVGAVGCRLLYSDSTIQHAGFVVRDNLDVFLTHEGLGFAGSDAGHMGRHALVHRTSAVTGACMAVRRDVFDALGGFDAARYPVDGNDVDFCFRARAAGFSVLYTPFSTLYHLASKTRGYGATEQQRRAAAAAVARLWARWGRAFGRDPYFNARFDRIATPFTRLRPPETFDGVDGRCGPLT